jgi:hypothetical protein
MVDRLKPIDMYTTVCMNVATFAANYDACLAPAILGSAKPTLGLSVLAVIDAALSKYIKKASTTEYTEEGKKREEEKKKKKMHYLPYL